MQERFTLMYGLLKDLNEDELRLGIETFCKKHLDVYPNTNIVAYIRKYAQADKFLSVDEAWSWVLDEIKIGFRKRYNAQAGGCSEPPEYKTPEIMKTVKAIRWDVLCNKNHESSVRQDFFKIYNQICERES